MKTVEDQRGILANNIKSLLEKKRISQTDMAREIGVAETTVSSWLNAKKYPRIDKIQLMADFFNVSRSAITEKKSDNVKYISDIVKIPVIGKIACGDPITAIENIEEYKERSIEGLPSGELFYLTAAGKSMEPVIRDGSSVLCRKQPDVENGEIAAVLVNGDEETTLKKVRKINGMIMLEPINDKYDPFIITEENPAKIVGKAVEVTYKL